MSVLYYCVQQTVKTLIEGIIEYNEEDTFKDSKRFINSEIDDTLISSHSFDLYIKENFDEIDYKKYKSFNCGNGIYSFIFMKENDNIYIIANFHNDKIRKKKCFLLKKFKKEDEMNDYLKSIIY